MDKGNTVVIDAKQEYIEDCLKHLNDPHTYNKLPNDPTTRIAKDIRRYLTVPQTGTDRPSHTRYMHATGGTLHTEILYAKQNAQGP